MIPILYEKDETAFSSNGLGRLRDAISVKVVEERNSIYECDFEYPVTGAHFDEITCGRIIGVEHDDTGDIQPFDIVSYTRPIDGVVTFHCTHISYRQSYLTVRGSNINSLADAFTLLGNATPSNPFSYSTDKTSTGYMAAADKIPKSVRQMLGGVEGSILDAYGGEFEWNRFNVILHGARGTDRDFTIRYSVNMIDYNEEYNIEGTYSSCVPYWTDGSAIVVGNRQDSGDSTVTGRGECVPLDVSDKFESKPTKAQVNAMGLSMISGKSIPGQNIQVEFIRLQDMPEYAGFGNLMQCSLCDTIKVIFPSGASGRFKIVRTVWDVLRDRYESMELGELSTTLSEALGITSDLSSTGVTNAWAEKVDEFISQAAEYYTDTTGSKSVATSTYTDVLKVENLSAGTWLFTGSVRFPSNSTGRRIIYISRTSGGDGAPNSHSYAQSTNALSSGTTMLNISCVLTVSEGDTIYLVGWQNSGSTLTVSSADLFAKRLN